MSHPLFLPPLPSTWLSMKRFIPFVKTDPLVAVVRLQGVIASGGRGTNLNDQTLAPVLEKAFRRGKPKHVALIINSPGGSPVQSSLIGARIKRLSDEHALPVSAFVEDVAASGGYWLATAAPEIILDPSSIVGSIGVISASFGFHELMERQGIERRVYTAGKDKSVLDPFRPERPADVKKIKAIQQQMHDTFIAHVKEGRGAKLPEDKDLFTGEFWVGQKAVDLGLADSLGHLVPVMKERYGDKVKFAKYGPRRSVFSRFGANLLSDALGQVEERALWAQYGL